MAGVLVCRVPLVLRREWTLYAFPPDVQPTDERGIPLGPEEIHQIIEAATDDLHEHANALTRQIAALTAEVESLREANAKHTHEKTLAQMQAR